MVVWVIIAFLVLVIIGNIMPRDSNYSNNEQPNTEKTWREVTTFSGKDTKDTPTFNIQGERFKLTYTVIPESGYPEYASFSVYAFEPGNDVYTSYASLDSGTDSTISYKGKGEYYLKIVAANLDGWSIKVEDYY